MTKTFTRYILTTCWSTVLTISLSAQINDESPVPVVFEILSPAGIAGPYGYGTQAADETSPIWGPTLTETVQGEVVWAFDSTDSLGCEEIVTDLEGKIALIRRGVCGFSVKAYRAQQAGAIGVIICNHFDDPDDGPFTLVNMLGSEFADEVTIPAIFISRNTCTIIDEALAEGPVVASFTTNSFLEPAAAYSYQTPQSQILPLDAIQVTYVNKDSLNSAEVEVYATITSPDGTETTLTQAREVGPLGDSLVVFEETYEPEAVGTYRVTFSNDQNSDTAATRFVISDYTFATDDGEILGGVGPTQTVFAQSSLRIQTGSLVLTGPDGAVATFASFGIENVDSLYTGNENADVFTIILYDADADGDEVLDFQPGGTASFDDLTAVAFGTYILTGEEEPNELIYVPLESIDEEVVTLKPNGAYYITVAYDGVEAGTGIAPQFTATADVDYPFNLTTPLYLDQLYSGFTGVTLVTRLHLDGFNNPTGVKKILPDYLVQVSPNPAGEYINLQFRLEETADQVRVGLLDFSGRLMRSAILSNVREQTIGFDVRQLPAGTYFFSILTPQGYRAEKVVISR